MNRLGIMLLKQSCGKRKSERKTGGGSGDVPLLNPLEAIVLDTIGVTAVERTLGERESAVERDDTTETPKSSQKQSPRPETQVTDGD